MAKYRTDHDYAVARSLRGTLGLAGNTYAEREWIRSLGGIFDKRSKEWRIPCPSNNRDTAALLWELKRRGIQWRQVTR